LPFNQIGCVILEKLITIVVTAYIVDLTNINRIKIYEICIITSWRVAGGVLTCIKAAVIVKISDYINDIDFNQSVYSPDLYIINSSAAPNIPAVIGLKD